MGREPTDLVVADPPQPRDVPSIKAQALVRRRAANRGGTPWMRIHGEQRISLVPKEDGWASAHYRKATAARGGKWHPAAH